MAEFVEYEIWLGTFEGEDFVWKVIKRFNDFDEAYAFYHEYIMKQSKYDDEELKKVWSSGRIDVELRQGKKLINWAGLFSRRVADPDFDPYEGSKKKKEDPSKGEAPSEAKDSAYEPQYGEEGDWQVVSPQAHFIWMCGSEEIARDQLEYVKKELGYPDAFIEKFEGGDWKKI